MRRYVLHVEPDVTGVAPRDSQWQAWFGDYDEGTVCGHGESADAAAVDLIENHGLPA